MVNEIQVDVCGQTYIMPESALVKGCLYIEAICHDLVKLNLEPVSNVKLVGKGWALVVVAAANHIAGSFRSTFSHVSADFVFCIMILDYLYRLVLYSIPVVLILLD